MRPAKTTRSRTGPPGPAIPSGADLRDVPLIRLPASAATDQGFRDWVLAAGLPRSVRPSYIARNIYFELGSSGVTIRIPPGVFTLDGFRAWATSDEFPQWGRISFIDQELWIDMSPEEIETHIKVKDEIARVLGNLNEERDLGEFFGDGTLVANDPVGLATELDGTFVKWSTFRSGRVELIPRKDRLGQYMEVRGRPDWVLEVISQSSVAKDTKQLPLKYHRAGIPEYWLIDARGEDIDFRILANRKAGFTAVAPKDGWYKSRVFGRRFRLERTRNRLGHWRYHLRVQPA